MKVDFLFIYEVKARELENICLLKYELESRGYSVAFINTWYYLRTRVPCYKAKVVVSFGLYNDATYKFICTFVNKFNKLINMQWEQVGTKSDEISEKSQFLISGLARNAVHICWGGNTKERLMQKCRIDEKKLKLTGHIALDFLRYNLVTYYRTKEEIFGQYNIPLQNKRVCLFISSFSYVNLPDNIIENTPDLGYDLRHFVRISNESQAEVIKWITRILSKDKDIIFIYRPHPAESENIELQKLSLSLSNFFVIGELSVKQWILVSDVIYNWYSTSFAEIFRSRKQCYILRPIQIPKDIDLAMCEGSKFICDFDSFESTIMAEPSGFPIKDEVIFGYYYIDENEPAYIKLCDSFIEVYTDDYYLLPKLKKSQKQSFLEKLKMVVYKSFISNIVDYLCIKTTLKVPILERRRLSMHSGYEMYRIKQAQINYVSKDEIETIVNRIKMILEKNR